MLKVLHTVEFYAPHTGGAESVVQQISERLAKRGHHVTVATSAHPERSFRELNGVEVCGFAVQGKLAERITGETARYERFLREHPADVMMNYAAQQWATDLALDVIADTAARRVNVLAACGYSALMDVQTLRWPHFRDYFEKVLPRVLPAYDAVVYHSGIYKDFEFGEHHQLRNGIIIPNGTDEEEFTRPYEADFREKYKITTRFFGLCVANFYPAKGLERLIESVRQMNRPDFTMVFIGKEGDQLASLQKQSAGLNIRFLAGIPREETVAAFRSADLFLFASHIEASPLVILEAKAAKLPFLSTDCGNVREWKGGVVCSPEDLASQAGRLLDDEPKRRQLAEEGWREWKDRLTWNAVVDQWEDLYLRLQARKSQAAAPMVATGNKWPAAASTDLDPQTAAALEVAMIAQTPPAEAVAADVRIVKSFGQEVLLGLIGEHPENPFPQIWLGLTHQARGDFAAAEKCFEAAQALVAPRWRTNWYQALLIRDDASRWGWRGYEQAQKLVDEVLAEQPGFVSAQVARSYFRGHYSQWGQDTLAEDFFAVNPVTKGVFVDVGAFDGETLSNSRRFFELGWAGICIEPVKDNFNSCARLYAGTEIRCVQRAVCDTEGMVAINAAGTGSTIVSAQQGGAVEQVQASRLATILDEQRLPRVDFLSIDAEGVDFEVLQSLDYDRWRPGLIVIEYNTDAEAKRRMEEFMAAKQYVLWHDNLQDLFFRTVESVEPANFWRERTLLPARPVPVVSTSQVALVSTMTSSILGVIFSKDRPLQLDGMLRSFFARCQDAHRCQMKVLYRASVEFQPLYDALIREYPTVGFVAEQDFRSDLIKLLGASELVLFVVDDNLFIRNFTATEMVEALREHPQAIGFSMRLGRNTTFCYPLNKMQRLPSFETVGPEILRYDWTSADCDFNYPLEVCSSVYRAADLLPLLREIPFKNPNTLEGELAARAPRFHTSLPQLLCFGLSRAFTNPINLVQKVCQNRAGEKSDHSPERLAERFRAGARLDAEAYINFTPTGCHQEVPLHFVKGSPSLSGPAVSVVVPCYKQAHYLPEAVQSVLDQTFTDWELIIVNDGSPDNTAEVARELAARHSDKMIVVLTQPNGGLSSARNAGMRAARGRYLLPLDADDKLMPEFLHETVAVLDRHVEISVAYTDLQCFEGSNEIIPKGDFGRNLMLENSVAYCSLFRREVWEAVGGYNPNMSAGYEDWDFWVGAVEREFRGHRIPKNLFLYRVRAQSIITSAMQRHRELVCRIILNHPRSYDEPSRNRAGELLLANPLPAARARAACISVVVPCYKQAQFLPESVASVVSQTCQNWEIIIVNDGSPDDTSVVAAQLMQKHPGRISLLEKVNGGLSSARNAGIRAAQGEYVFLLDADDRIQPTMLEKTKAVLDTRPKIGFAYTHIQHFGDLTNVYLLPDFDRGTLIYKDNIVCVMSLVRKGAWQQVGGYNEAMREGYEDWDFWIGCVEHGWEGFRIPEPLACYRKSATSMLTEATKKRKRLIATIVCNHPKLYDAKTRAWADDVLRKATAQAESTSRNAQSLASLRVTYLISSILGVTGGNQTLLRQADELQRRGHDVTIVTYTPKPDWFTFKMRVVQVPYGQAMAPHVPPSDVVISTYFINTHELLAVTAAVKVYYAQGDQFIFADTTLADSEENQRWRQLSRASYLLPNVRFVPNSHNLARAVEKMTGRKPDGLLPVCTDQTIFRPLQRSLPGSKVRILIVGPDVRGSSAEPLLFKGIQDIHDALHLLVKRHPNFTVVRMSGSLPEIFQRFPCEFYVAPSDEMKTVLFGTADILIYASHYDSCPRPPQEAMASGCAVVCTATPGAMEYCRDGENCLLVPIQSPQSIADATLRLMQDRALREKLVQGGLATAREYPREHEWNELETMLQGFVEEASNAPTPTRASLPLHPA